MSRATRDGTAVAVYVLLVASLWPLVRPYMGINGDAHLYALQALAHLHPERYANDLYFLFGSQDQFTLLSAIVAPAYRQFGVDRASALLLGLSMVAWCTAAFLLARAIGTRNLALASLAALICVPGWYGGGLVVFRYAEPSFVARLPAEAAVLASLAATVWGRARVGAALLIAAGLLHPIMAVPGVAVTILLHSPRERWRLWIVVALATTCVLAACATLAPMHSIEIVDKAWLDVLERRSWFLFPTWWTRFDWENAAVTLASLAIASRTLPQTAAGRLAAATLIVAAGGLAVSLLAGDLIPVKLVVQTQPWRAMWLATCVAVMLMPFVYSATFRSRSAGFAAALMLTAAYFALGSNACLPALVSAILLAYLPFTPSSNILRLINVGAISAVAVLASASLMSAIEFLEIPVFGSADAAPLEQLRNIFGLPSNALLLVAAAWFACFVRSRLVRILIPAATAAMLALLIAPAVSSEFLRQDYSGASYRFFADWRTRIPDGANVAWPVNAAAVWFLLERPSYVSASQSAGVVYSRKLALESVRRARQMAPTCNPEFVYGGRRDLLDTKPLSLAGLEQLCSDASLAFVVSPDFVQGAVGSARWPDRTKSIYLYDCNIARRDSSQGPPPSESLPGTPQTDPL